MKKLFSLCVFCFLLLFLVGSYGIGAGNQGEGEIIEVDIKVDKTYGKKPIITVSPYSRGAHFEDTIVWKSDSPFAIHFGSSSPVEGLVFWGKSKDEAFETNLGLKEHVASFKDDPENKWKWVQYVVTTKVAHNPRTSGGIKAVYYIAFYNGITVGIIDPDIVVPPKGGGPRE